MKAFALAPATTCVVTDRDNLNPLLHRHHLTIVDTVRHVLAKTRTPCQIRTVVPTRDVAHEVACLLTTDNLAYTLGSVFHSTQAIEQVLGYRFDIVNENGVNGDEIFNLMNFIGYRHQSGDDTAVIIEFFAQALETWVTALLNYPVKPHGLTITFRPNSNLLIATDGNLPVKAKTSAPLSEDLYKAFALLWADMCCGYGGLTRLIHRLRPVLDVETVLSA